jgi:Lrp/AsnC family leucine-responsive transcriptional regulator
MVKSSKEQKQEDEMKILAELTKKSNESIGTIAKHCGLSRQKVWRSIKQLEEKHIIWGYTAIFDEKKIGLTHFILMIKRTMKQPGETTADKIISRKIEDLIKKLGIAIESSFYVHGEYDWIITFTSMDIKHAKQIYDSLITLYPGVIEKITIMETLMFIRKQYILNPDKKNLRDFL